MYNDKALFEGGGRTPWTHNWQGRGAPVLIFGAIQTKKDETNPKSLYRELISCKENYKHNMMEKSDS